MQSTYNGYIEFLLQSGPQIRVLRQRLRLIGKHVRRGYMLSHRVSFDLVSPTLGDYEAVRNLCNNSKDPFEQQRGNQLIDYCFQVFE